MKIAILCPGPTLPSTWCDDFFPEFDLVVGVNTAAHHYRTHYLVGKDPHVLRPVFDKKVPRPLCGLVTARAWMAKTALLGMKWHPFPLNRVRCLAAAPYVCKAVNSDVCGYSFPNALQFAYDYGAKSIDVHGFDQARQPLDFSGQKGDHSENRWLKETLWLRVLWASWIVNHGRAPSPLT